jgi:hypothetical protein
VRFTEIQIGNTNGTEGGGAIHQQFSEESVQSLLRWTGIPSLLEPEDVVDAVVWALDVDPRADRSHRAPRAGGHPHLRETVRGEREVRHGSVRR